MSRKHIRNINYEDLNQVIEALHHEYCTTHDKSYRNLRRIKNEMNKAQRALAQQTGVMERDNRTLAPPRQTIQYATPTAFYDRTNDPYPPTNDFYGVGVTTIIPTAPIFTQDLYDRLFADLFGKIEASQPRKKPRKLNLPDWF